MILLKRLLILEYMNVRVIMIAKRLENPGSIDGKILINFLDAIKGTMVLKLELLMQLDLVYVHHIKIVSII
jgi:hypothetical protein